MKKVCFALLILSLAASSAFAQKVSIDYRFNAAADDSKNYFNWTLDGKTVKDGFDASTGASKAQSTTAFNAVRYDGPDSKKNAIPEGLRSLVLYSVAGYSTAAGDAFSVEENGKQLTIRFIHRGNAYMIKTDANGTIDLASSFSIARGLADNIAGKFMLKKEVLKDGGSASKMSDLDWSKVTLVPDTSAPDASKAFTGTLKATYRKGILTIKGNLSAK